MSDRKVRNISGLQQPLLLRVLNEQGTSDIIVMLSSDEVFWCPENRETKSMFVYEKRGFLEFINQEKPRGAMYYESYPDGYWKRHEIAEDEEFVSEEGFDDDEGSKNEEPSNKTPSTSQQISDAPDSDDHLRVKWQDEDLKWLKKNYPKHGLSYCAEHLNRSKSSVKKKVEALKLRKEK